MVTPSDGIVPVFAWKGMDVAQPEEIILVLQGGGGALGAREAGAFKRLHAEELSLELGGRDLHQRDQRRAHLRQPTRIAARPTGGVPGRRDARPGPGPGLAGAQCRALYGEMIAARVVAQGVPVFFRPRSPLAFLPPGLAPVDSAYDTAPLGGTLERLADFDYLDDHGPRASVGAIDIETSNFAYFDSSWIRIKPVHITASGALPPGFPPVEIEGRVYWDGGLVSNTPLQYVMENLTGPACIFQVDLFSARGARPYRCRKP